MNNLISAKIMSYQEALKRLIDGEVFYFRVKQNYIPISFCVNDLVNKVNSRECFADAFYLGSGSGNLCLEDALAVFTTWKKVALLDDLDKKQRYTPSGSCLYLIVRETNEGATIPPHVRPTTYQGSYESAMKEAKRLCQTTGHSFLVFEAKHKVSPVFSPVITNL